MENKKQSENKNFYRLVFGLLLIITILSCFYIIRYFYDMHISKSQSKLLNEVNITEDDNIILSNVSLEDSEEKKKMERMKMMILLVGLRLKILILIIQFCKLMTIAFI